MHLAAISGSVDCIKYLFHRKSPVDIQDAASMTPLHYAGIFLVIICFASYLDKVSVIYVLQPP